jgi:hypothetical protein
MTEQETDPIRDMQYKLMGARLARDALETEIKDQKLEVITQIELLALDPEHKARLSNDKKRAVEVQKILLKDPNYALKEVELYELNKEVQTLEIEIEFQGRQFTRWNREAELDTAKYERENLRILEELKIE